MKYCHYTEGGVEPWREQLHAAMILLHESSTSYMIQQYYGLRYTLFSFVLLKYTVMSLRFTKNVSCSEIKSHLSN